MSEANRDQNYVPVALGQSSTNAAVTIPFQIVQATGRLKTDAAGGGSVTDVSVVSANGFAGSVANSTSTPAITISTTINSPILAGNGTAIAAATTTGSGSTAVLATAPVFPTTITVGVASGTTGSILLKGTTSGTITLKSADSAGTWTFTLPTTDGNSGEVLTTDGNGVTSWSANGVGDVVGPASATDNAVARFDGTTGKLVQNSAVLIADTTGVISGTQGLTFTGTTSGTLATKSAAIAGSNTLTFPALTGTAVVVGTNAQNIANVMQFGPTGYPTSSYPATTNAYFVVDKAGTASDSSIVFRDQGNARAEIGLVSDNAIHFKTVTGSYASEVFTDRMTITTAGLVAVGTQNLTPDSIFHVTGSTDPTNLFIGETGSGRHALELAYNFSSDKSTVVSIQRGTAYKALELDSLQTEFYQGSGSVALVATMTSTGLLLAENSSIQLDPAGSADGKYTGTTVTGTAGTTLAFGDLIYLAVADSRWELTDADAATTSDRMLGMCVLAAAADGDPTRILLQGIIRADAKFPTLTVGAAAYVGESAGLIQVAIPTGADNVIRRVGYAMTADELYFNPSMDSQTTVA